MAADASCEGVPAASHEDREVGGSGTVMHPNVMKHNDLQLQELLRLARSCLKYDRLPGELSERGFFDKFDAEHAERAKLDAELAAQSKQAASASLTSGASMEESSPRPSLELSPPLESPGEDPPDVQTLKEQTAQIERATAEAQMAIEAANVDLRNEVVKRWQLEKDEKAREVELQRAQHQLRLAKGMVKRQNVELKELHATLKTLQLAASSTQSAPAELTTQTPQPPSGPARQKARPAPHVIPQGPRASAKAEADGAPAMSAASLQGSRSSVSEPSYPRHQSLASVTTSFLPPKSRIMESVLATSNKNADMWKLYIP